MKKLLLPFALLALMGQGCFSSPAPVTPPPAPAPIPESSEQNMPPQDNTTPPPAPGTSTYNVRIQDYAYAPTSITVKKGDKIIFLNSDSVAHTVTSDAKGFDSGLISQSKGWTLDTTGLAPGTYPYHCTPHPMMKGTLIVK